MKEISILLVAIGGYGSSYMDALLDNDVKEAFVIAGIVDPVPENYLRYDEVIRRNIPVYSSMEEFYAQSDADLAVISSPIQYHAIQTYTALKYESNVLCEKPITATIQDAKKLIEVSKKTRKFVAVGFQWSYNDAILSLKHDIMSGIFGEAKAMKALVLWPRSHRYFNRNNWSGKKKDCNGQWVLDSVANNAAARYLHNMFFLLGNEMNRSAKPTAGQAELYKANPIENFDTVAARVMTEKEVEILFYASHAVSQEHEPVFKFTFERGTISYNTSENENIIARMQDGKTINYGDPNIGNINKLWAAIKAVRNGGTLPCTIETASSQVLCVNGMQESVPDIAEFPQSVIKYKYDRENGDKLTYVNGLEDIFLQCFQLEKLPNQIGIPWAKSGKEVSLMNYKYFGHGNCSC